MPERYGLLGRSLAHSFSKDFFTRKFTTQSIDATYQNFEIKEIAEFPAVLSGYSDLRGLNVTLPYKESIIPFLEEIDVEAREIGAVNTIVIREGKTKGYNTDAHGFLQSLRPFLTWQHDKALLLGNGGAARAARHALEQMGVTCLNVQRSQCARGKAVLWSDLNEEAIKQFKLIVNCTPLGMWPDTESFPLIPYQAIGSGHLLFDMVYNPIETTFLKMGREAGASVMNGLDMLRFQAERSWEIWHE